MLLVDADRPEPVRGGARELAVFLTPEPGAEAKEVEETIEGLLLRLEEFCSLADMIRSDTSQILEENIPLLKAKVVEMRGIYAKVDQLDVSTGPLSRWSDDTSPSWRPTCSRPSGTTGPSRRPCGSGWVPRGSPRSETGDGHRWPRRSSCPRCTEQRTIFPWTWGR
uniref:Breast carcinoma amplified sequence 4 n=1 Tax=Ovis aries TaxID=9940 RepID=A0AC11BJR6_SHEEP